MWKISRHKKSKENRIYLNINKTLTNILPLKKYIVKYRKILAAGLLFLIFNNLIQICEPVIINNCFNLLKKDYLLPHRLIKICEYLGINTKYGLLIFFTFLYFLVNLIRLPFIYLHRLLIKSAAKGIECDLRSEFFNHLQRLPLFYYHREKTGDIMVRFSDDTRCVDEFAEVSIALGNYLILAPVSFIYLYLVGKTLIFYSLIPLVGVSITAYIFSKYIHKHMRIVQQHFGCLSTKVQENLSGIRILKLYVQEENEINNFKKINSKNIEKSMAFYKIYGFGLSSVLFLIGLSQLIFLWLGCGFIISGRITPGNFAAFFYQLEYLMWPILMLGVSINLFQQALARLERINEVLFQRPDIDDCEKTDDSITTIEGEIEFKNLTFLFEGRGVAALKDINIRFEKGKSVGIIGEIGSGKSTLLNLIARLYEAQDGMIFIGGYPINKIPLKILRTNIGYVPEEAFLFSGGIKENICFGFPEVNQELLDRASVISQIKKDIDEFPKGYETLVGERGVDLSGGQKQRITLARAVIIQPKILLLDNALSQLDADTEREVLKNLKREMNDCTIIFVSNRITTIKNADLIVVIMNGQILETGGHYELLSKGRFYPSFYKRELLEEELAWR